MLNKVTTLIRLILVHLCSLFSIVYALDPQTIMHHTINIFNVRLFTVKGKQHKGNRVAYVFNHRSFADFMIDTCVIQSKFYMISRAMVALAFPFVILWLKFKKHVFIFHRKGNKARRDYRMEKLMSVSRHPIIFYPEGTRRRKPGHRLHSGITRKLYRWEWSIQAVYVTNKLNVLDEKTMSSSYGTRCNVFWGDVVHPQQHDTVESFIDAVNNAFRTCEHLAVNTKQFDTNDAIHTNVSQANTYINLTLTTLIMILFPKVLMWIVLLKMFMAVTIVKYARYIL